MGFAVTTAATAAEHCGNDVVRGRRKGGEERERKPRAAGLFAHGHVLPERCDRCSFILRKFSPLSFAFLMPQSPYRTPSETHFPPYFFSFIRVLWLEKQDYSLRIVFSYMYIASVMFILYSPMMTSYYSKTKNQNYIVGLIMC